jgi:hypothetical protein
VRGHEVAKLKWEEEGASFLFVPGEEFHPGHAEWRWSQNRQDATQINQFLNGLYDEFAGNDMEREVQWQLARAVRAQNRLQEFENLLPVLWMGVPTEIGTCLTAAGQLGIGTLDLLARRRGGRAGARFVVFEVKGPTHNTENEIIYSLRQAVRYALALSIEANANPTTKANYRTAFQAGGNAALSFRAAAVIHDPKHGDNTEVRQRALAALRMFAPPQGALVDLVGLLLYSWDAQEQKAYNWRWVCDPHRLQRRPGKCR